MSVEQFRSSLTEIKQRFELLSCFGDDRRQAGRHNNDVTGLVAAPLSRFACFRIAGQANSLTP